MLISRGRYLHFDNLDMSAPFISSKCSLCGCEFDEAPVSGEHIDLVLMRIRARFDAHECIPERSLGNWNTHSVINRGFPRR